MNDRHHHSGGVSRNVYRDLRLRNERRMKFARVSETRRLSQIERVVQMARERRFRGPQK